jgi:hypothetical protein
MRCGGERTYLLPLGAAVLTEQLDEDTEFATYLGAFAFRACHDMSVFKEPGLLAAACLSEGFESRSGCEALRPASRLVRSDSIGPAGIRPGLSLDENWAAQTPQGPWLANGRSA